MCILPFFILRGFFEYLLCARCCATHRDLEVKKAGESPIIYLVMETAYFSVEETTH